MRRRMHGALVGALGLAMGVGAVLAGTGTASAATSSTAGTVTLTPRSDSITDGSPFTKVSVNKACPTDYQDNVGVYLVVPDGTESALAFNVTDGAPFTRAPFTAQVPAASTDTTYVNSIADAFSNVNATLADGTYPIHVVCGNADSAAFPERPTFTGFIDVTGDTWQVDSRRAPVATTIQLTASPAGHVQVGQPTTLTARITPGVSGTVQFTANGFNPIGGPVQVVNGVATAQVPAVGRPGTALYTATFVPADQLTYAQAYGVLDYAVVAAPTITVTDANGAVLGATPQLTPGQRITLSATGFQPGSGEQVAVSIPRVYYGVLPAVFPSATSDSVGSVADYSLTIPDCIPDGSHTLTLTGADTHIKITFAFTTKRS